VLSQIRFTEWLRRWELKIRKLAASSKTSSKLFNMNWARGLVALTAWNKIILPFPQWLWLAVLNKWVTFSMGHAGASRKSPNDAPWVILRQTLTRPSWSANHSGGSWSMEMEYSLSLLRLQTCFGGIKWYINLLRISMTEQLSGVVQVPCRCPGNCQEWCKNWPTGS